jgi:metal-dependent amidase/aminoacylase/carboxypeptidase family protein
MELVVGSQTSKVLPAGNAARRRWVRSVAVSHFALFLRRAPGAMFYLGVANADAGLNGVPHAPDLAADEQAIGFGVRGMAGLLLSRVDVLHTAVRRSRCYMR